MDFKLQFPPTQIKQLASKFSYPKDESEITEGIKPYAMKRGYLMLEELQTVCLWKSARSKSRVASNLAEDVEALTKVFLETTNERLRIGSLQLLNGIEYPTASVFMHFIHPDPYPILDFRALEALGIEKPAVYTFDFWYKYVLFTRQLAKENEVDMRTLDKALWQWSKENGSGKLVEVED